VTGPPDLPVASRFVWFLPLVTVTGVVTSLTAPLEVLFARQFAPGGLRLGAFMVAASAGVVVVDVLGTRLVPALDSRSGLAAGLAVFGVACVGMGLASTEAALITARALQGLGGGLVLGCGLQAAVRVPHRSRVRAPRRPGAAETAGSSPGAAPASELARFSAALLFGAAVAAPLGLAFAGALSGMRGYRAALLGTGAAALVTAALCLLLPALGAPAGTPAPRLGLPDLRGGTASASSLVLATSGDFLRGGVLFTALPLAGAARGYPTLTISEAIAAMSGTEILVLLVAARLVALLGVAALLQVALVVSGVSAAILVFADEPPAFLAVSALFGAALAGATVTLPLLVIAQSQGSAAGLARYRICAGAGMLAGSTGCAVLAEEVGVQPLFLTVALLLLLLVPLARRIRRAPPPAIVSKHR